MEHRQGDDPGACCQQVAVVNLTGTPATGVRVQYFPVSGGYYWSGPYRGAGDNLCVRRRTATPRPRPGLRP
ncbi:MAG: hypothetical protein R3F43_10885 [bacterium]